VMTPLVKGWCTEVSMETTSLGVQVHGGMGFIEETGAAQHMRDARILPIYEGTNGIQALDFIGRKCLRDGGQGVQGLIDQMQATSDSLRSASGQVAQLRKSLDGSIAECRAALQHVLAHSDESQATAYHFMMLFGTAVGYWLLVKLAAAAQKRLDDGSDERFYHQKIATAAFYATQILPRSHSHLTSLQRNENYARAMTADDFITL
jgi:3-(methylthio)propanoyl-CoA dehydrogenase